MSQTKKDITDFSEDLCKAFRSHSLPFREAARKEGKTLTLSFPDKTAPSMNILINRDGDCGIRSTLAYCVCQENQPDMMRVLNELNSTYRYICFSLDRDGDVCAGYDLTLRNATESLYAQIIEVLLLFSQIIGEAIPSITKAAAQQSDTEDNQDSFGRIKVNPFEEE